MSKIQLSLTIYESDKDVLNRLLDDSNLAYWLSKGEDKREKDALQKRVEELEEQLEIISAQIPKGAVDLDKIGHHAVAACKLKSDLEKALAAYQTSFNQIINK